MKKKIVFTLPTLQGGGAEKVISNIASNLNKSKYDVYVVVFDLTKQKFLKNQKIKIINLNSKKISLGLLNFIKIINNLNPDVLLSSVGHLNLFVSVIRIFLPKKLKVITRESNFLSQNIKLQSSYYIMKILYKLFYNNVDQVLVFSKKHKLDMIKNTNVNYKKIKIIPNPLDFENIKKLSKVKIKKKFKKLFYHQKLKYVFVGSLSFQKGIDIFIESLSYINNKNFVFNIIGSGSEKNNLLKLSKNRKMSEKINFIPYQNNPYPYILKSDVFIMCSRFEGMSNTVLETLSLNKPIIFLNNTGASTELLKKAKNTYSINSNNPFFISKKLSQYKLTKIKYSNFDIIKKFRIKKILEKYEKLLDDIF